MSAPGRAGRPRQLGDRIEATAPKVAEVIRGIHRRPPYAQVVVVGYPDLFPDDGAGCTSSSVPFAAGDFTYLRDTEKPLNTMLAAQARKANARYVDTCTPTVGHDMCRPASGGSRPSPPGRRRRRPIPMPGVRRPWPPR
jgi:hypothetical protein